MTQETTNEKKSEVNEIDKAWYELWLFASNQIIWNEGCIDFDGFKELGQQQFDIKVKE